MNEISLLEHLIALVTLTSLEIVLGIDNIVFIVVITARLREAVRDKARKLGIFLAMFSRIFLLLGIVWIMKLTIPLFSVGGHIFTGKDLVLLGGGVFLLGKATFEIHDKLEGGASEKTSRKGSASYGMAIVQIVLLDIIFSLDSVITAVGMARALWVMIVAIMIAVAVMFFFSKPVGEFVHRHPTVQMLAFSFLLLVGVFLVAEGLGKHIDRGYIYFAMAFSLFVEILNLKLRKKEGREPIQSSPWSTGSP